MSHSVNRRALLAGTGLATIAAVPGIQAHSTPVLNESAAELIIDLPAEPLTIHPARAYSDLEWSVVHSIFDALIGFDAEGTMLPLAAERFDLIDDVTWEVTLRPNMTFHDGTPVTAAAIERGFDLVSGSDSLVADIFGVVAKVEAVDDLTARIIVATPSPWLPAQMASWHVLIPEPFSADEPVGSGPYVFENWSRGVEITLRRFGEYVPSVTKGAAIADTVRYHFVPDVTTRTSNVLTGTSDIATFIPIDALSAFANDGVQLRTTSVAGSWFVRIANDAAPFDDTRVRQALNLALDLDAFVGVLVYEGSERIASIYPGPVSMGFDPALAPYAYDPEAARALLTEAGYPDGIDAQMEVASDASTSVCEAIISQWSEIGVRVELIVSDLGSFNAGWTDPEAPALRMASWSPLFDPSTLLNLVFYSEGVLSRYHNPTADQLIATGGSTIEEDDRAEAYRALGSELHQDAAAVFLWNLVNVAGVSDRALGWTPRPDQWVLALAR